MSEYIVRQIREEDAEEYLELCKQIDAETKFMLREPGERITTVEQQLQQIRNVLASTNQMIFVAEVDGRLVGYLAAFGGQLKRNRHSAHVVAGIRLNYVNQGIGTALFRALDDWARSAGLHRLELTVMTHNERALHLYQKMGFQIEGRGVHTLCVDGKYVDEFYMAKLL
jgi:RimJ/RimL family protein N-acetyltransferase